MKVSIITVTYNSDKTLQDTLDSVRKQSYDNLEYIIIDGNSSDKTVYIIKQNLDIIAKWVSEPDKGLYDAMNKGIKMATGEIVGIINSDDFYHRSDAISKIVQTFEENSVECVFADVIFVNQFNTNKVIRYYSSAKFRPWKMKFGFMPAHPTFFTYKRNFEKLGIYKDSYIIGADFELLLRYLVKNKLSYKYIPLDLLKMRVGGLSTSSIKSNFLINKENLKAFKENGLFTNYLFLYSRYFIKSFHFIPWRNKKKMEKINKKL